MTRPNVRLIGQFVQREQGARHRRAGKPRVFEVASGAPLGWCPRELAARSRRCLLRERYGFAIFA
jgi:hypothetical protein